MAGIRGRSGPHPEIRNAFRLGLAGIAQRRSDGVLNPAEQSENKSYPAYWPTRAEPRSQIVAFRQLQD